ncbi:Similar to hypothetical protein [Tuber melanosporum Mel28]; acc. no. XP_002837071 [Pyronema omphalodes CBS 100304]|uniref:BZIP domain-containing protein n=1 Tax=Pyronema omphalodes (strain CBS 100304) TaxID=1076935 RepID=U4KUE9_PYROM|nr:Similar to hypothetical protein [Tuber melanosporum Mel28]; acc. no. XP_002837071 [Pyronema omphalodes CBS 100304]
MNNNNDTMRDPQSGQYPEIRRSSRQHYASTISMSQPAQYHTSAEQPYPLDLSFPPQHIGTSQRPTPGNGYLDSFSTGLPDVMEMEMPPPFGMDLGILSSQHHRDLRLLSSRPKEGSGSESVHDGVSGESGGSGRSRQRLQRSTRAQSDDSIDTPPAMPGKKQRGRPRLDPTDENAADRRRTQIRLAQRAYRLRKETTISSLRSRVTDLENAIEGMQNTFLELHEFAMGSTAKHDQRTIKALTERFMAQSKAALGIENPEMLPEEEHEDGRGSPHNTHTENSERPRSRDDGGPTSGGSSGLGGIAAWGGFQNPSYTRGQNQDDGNNYCPPVDSTSRSTYESIPNDQSNFFMDPHQVATTSARSELLYGYPSPPISHELEVPKSYAYNEGSFSRRLHRSALENAYRLLSNPNTNESDIARIFAYTLCYASKKDVMNTVTHLLRAGSTDSLSPRDYPQLVGQYPPKPLDKYDDILQAYQDKARMDILGNGNNAALREAAHKQLKKLGIHNKFLRPIDVENVLIENGILDNNNGNNGNPNSFNRNFPQSSPESLNDLRYQTSSSPRTPPQGLYQKASEARTSPNGGLRSIPSGGSGLSVKKSVDLELFIKEEYV